MWPSDCETIAPSVRPPNEDGVVWLQIADMQEESKDEDAVDTADLRVYLDSSGIEGMAGAAAIMFRNGQEVKSIRYLLGLLTRHTTYEAGGGCFAGVGAHSQGALHFVHHYMT